MSNEIDWEAAMTAAAETEQGRQSMAVRIAVTPFDLAETTRTAEFLPSPFEITDWRLGRVLITAVRASKTVREDGSPQRKVEGFARMTRQHQWIRLPEDLCDFLLELADTARRGGPAMTYPEHDN